MQNTYDPLKQYLQSNNQAFSADNLKSLATSKGFDNYSMSDADNAKLTGMLNTPASSVYSSATATNSSPSSVSGSTGGASGYTPVQDTNTQPTMSDIYGNNEYNTAIQSSIDYYSDPTAFLEKQGISQSSFKTKALSEMQAQIDATNAMYANKLAESKRLGGNLIGQTGAIQARRGLLGSDFGAAQTADINTKNQQVYDLVEQERLAAINDIYSKAEQASTTRFAEARALAESGIKGKLESIKMKQERIKTGASEIAQDLINSGVTNPSATELTRLASAAGTTKNAIESALASLQYASDQGEKKRKQDIEDAIAKKGLETIGEGQQAYMYNPSTGQYEFVANNPKASTTSTATTYTADGQPMVSQEAMTIFELMNRKGGKLDDYVKDSEGNSKVRNEVNQLLLANGGLSDFTKTANQTAFTSIANTVEELRKKKVLAGDWRTRLTDPNKFGSTLSNLTANEYTNFVNQVDGLKGQLLRLDGVALKEIFGPQISNADAASIERIIGNALDPLNQDPTNFNASLDRIVNGLQKYNQTYGIPGAIPNYKNAFDIIINQNSPENTKIINARVGDLQQLLGRQPTPEEYFEVHPYDIPQGFNQVGGDTKPVSAVTDPARKIVGGIDLNGYAMDPNQANAVSTIYAKLPESNFDTYIQSKFPKSAITDAAIQSVANAFGIVPKILVALMQHESKMGTTNVALKNNNYGGITWSESYAKSNPGAMKGSPRPASEGGYYVKFATPEEGLAAQAKLLSKRKIA